jgi:hypothetical protein
MTCSEPSRADQPHPMRSPARAGKAQRSPLQGSPQASGSTARTLRARRAAIAPTPFPGLRRSALGERGAINTPVPNSVDSGVGAGDGTTDEGDVRRLVIRADSLESAQAYNNLLWRHHPEFTSHSGEYQVSVEVASDTHLIAALTAIHEYVAERNHSTCVELDGRRYTLQPA